MKDQSNQLAVAEQLRKGLEEAIRDAKFRHNPSGLLATAGMSCPMTAPSLAKPKAAVPKPRES